MLTACSSGPPQRSAPPASAQTSATQPPALSHPTLADQARLVSVVESVEPWPFDMGGGQAIAGTIITTPNYRMFVTETNPATVDRAPRFLELALAHWRAGITGQASPLPAPPARLESFFMDNRAQWKSLVAKSLGAQAATYLNIPRGGFATGGRAYLYDIGVFDTLAIAAHEGWHQYTQRTFALPLPIWLEEGLASYMEGHKWEGATPRFLPWANVERFDQLREAAAKGQIRSLRELVELAPQDLLMHAGDVALTYYAQVWALSHYLASGERREALARLLSEFASGAAGSAMARTLGAAEAADGIARRRGNHALRAYFGQDLEKLEIGYAAFVRAVAQPGSRGPIVAGQPPPGAGLDR